MKKLNITQSTIALSFVIMMSFFLFFPYLVFSQTIPQDISININPKYPKPGTAVRVYLDSSEVNLDFETITWYVDGVKVASGEAATSIELNLSKDIKKYTVQAYIGVGLDPVIREITIAPGSLVLLWEAVDSYSPAWYWGKPLLPSEGLVRVTAIPVGTDTLDKLFFLWKQGERTLSNQSGFGKSSIVLRNNLMIGDMDMSVTASSPDGSYAATGSVFISVAEPDIRFWVPRILSAPVFPRLGKITISDKNALLSVIPYNMRSYDGLRSLIYAWRLNDNEYIPPEEEPENQVYLSSISTSIGVKVNSVETLTAEGEAKTYIDFK